MNDLGRIALGMGLLFLLAPKRTRVNSAKEDTPASGWTDSRSVLIEALGVPYSYGAGTPASPWPGGAAGLAGGVGWDCSGYAQAGLVQLGLLSSGAVDRTAQSLADRASGVSSGDEREGDLAFYGASWSKVSHVMLCLGNGQVIGASGGGRATNGDDVGAYVKIFNTPEYRSDFLGVRRLW